MPSPVHTGKNAHLGSKNQHTVGKSTGLFCWLVISLGPTNQPLKFTLEKQAFISWFHLAYGLGNLELSPENGLVFIKLANACSLEHTEERVQCTNTQGLWSTLSFSRMHYSRIIYCGLGETHTPRLISFFFHSNIVKVLSLLSNLLISEEWSIISYQLFSISTCSTKSNSIKKAAMRGATIKWRKWK